MHHLTMDSFTVELVSNASFDCYPNNTLSVYQLFTRTNKPGRMGVANSELSYPSMYQNITGGKFYLLMTPLIEPSNHGKILKLYFLAPGLYPIAAVVKAMNKLISEREN